MIDAVTHFMSLILHCVCVKCLEKSKLKRTLQHTSSSNLAPPSDLLQTHVPPRTFTLPTRSF